MIEMRDLSKSYIERNGEERRVFEGLSFSPEKGGAFDCDHWAQRSWQDHAAEDYCWA